MMTEDLVSILGGNFDSADLLQAFLARIRAWQDFMRRGKDGVLGADEEVGLFGELEILHDLVLNGVRAKAAVESWQGPVGGLQDFALGRGALEVKSTVSPTGFLVTVASLEQLDDSLVQPLFVAGVRLALGASGRTLPEQVGRLRGIFDNEPEALGIFNGRLLHGGFIDVTAQHYTRRFSGAGTRILRVIDGFPRLTRLNVAIGVKQARYEVDLDLIANHDVGLPDVLKELV